MPAPLAVAAARVGVSFLRTPTGRAVVGAAVVGALALPVGAALMGAAVVSSLTQTVAGGAAVAESTCVAATTPVAGGTDATLDEQQRENGGLILAVVKGTNALGDEPARKRAGVIAVAVALQESSLRNLTGGDRDSLGLFQQRPSMGWGTPEQIQDPVYATRSFLLGRGTNPGLVAVTGWQTGELAAVAQAVQRSANGALYATREAAAQSLVDELWDATTPMEFDDDLDEPAPPVTVPVSNGTDCTDDPAPVSGGGSGGAGAWGGYENGRIPASALCPLVWAPGQLLRCDAASALSELDAAYQAQFGTHISITDSYRDYAGQVAARERWCARGACHMAATPGTSNHGWALALDLGGGINSWGTTERAWMVANAPAAGWISPDWAQPGRGKEEPWHWEFTGTSAEEAGA